MKILMATTYVYNKDWEEFTRNKTGLGIMVYDIFKSISLLADTYLITHVITKGRGNNVLRHRLIDVITNICLKDFLQALKWFLGYNQSFGMRMRYAYYVLNKGYFRKVIALLKPDVVHIHGMGFAIRTYIEVCEEMKIPYILTHHGLIGLNASMNALKWEKDYEKSFLIKAEQNGIPVTVISSGMKRRIQEHYIGHESDNIRVITNGTKIPVIGKLSSDFRKDYSISKEEKICVVLGTICERNNQIQIVRAFAKTEWAREHAHVFICGIEKDEESLEEFIKQHNLCGRVHVLPLIECSTIKRLLSQADLNICACKDIGYGMDIIDMAKIGIPTVTFRDLNAVCDLSDRNAILVAEKRSDEEFAQIIDEALQKKWDSAYIQRYGGNAYLERIKDNFEHEYIEMINNGVFNFAKVLDYCRVMKSKGYRLLSYVGNITDNKNQQMLALTINEKLKDEKIYAIYAGKEADNGGLKKIILNNASQNLMVGFCDELESLWPLIDLNVFLSKNDGFGLSIIEAAKNGVPSIAYSDLDAIPDLENKAYLVTIDGKTTESVAHSIRYALSNAWDSEQIKECSTFFSLERMADKYLDLYKEVSTFHNN